MPPMGLFDIDRLGRVVVTLGQVATAAVAVLVLTGVPLAFVYEPGGGALAGLHSLASALLIGCAAGVLTCVVVARVRRSPLWVGWSLSIVGVLVVAAGSVSGQYLRWSALRPADDGARGLTGPLGGGVDAIVVGDASLSPGSFGLWTVVHLIVVPAALAGVARWFTRRMPAEPAPEAAATGPADPGDGDASTDDHAAVDRDGSRPGRVEH